MTVLHFQPHWHVKPIWEQKEKFYRALGKHPASGKNLILSERESSFLACTPESFISTQKEMEQRKLSYSGDKPKARIKA